MNTENILVYNNSLGQEILPVNSWYRIPPATAIKIVKELRTPAITHYTDSTVGSSSFASYQPKTYDKSITWNVDTALTITRAIDAGSVVDIPNVTQSNESFGNGTVSFVLSR